MFGRMKPIALFFVVSSCLIETVGFGWLAFEFWPDMILVGVIVAALLICLPYSVFAGRVIDRRLRQIEDGQDSRDGRTAAVERM
jgi:hypothetical protein